MCIFPLRKCIFSIKLKNSDKTMEKNSSVRLLSVLSIKQLSHDFLEQCGKFFTCFSYFAVLEKYEKFVKYFSYGTMNRPITIKYEHHIAIRSKCFLFFVCLFFSLVLISYLHCNFVISKSITVIVSEKVTQNSKGTLSDILNEAFYKIG